jgi:hemoglobin
MNEAATPYSLIGGEAVLRRLVKRFYELMDTLPEAYGIRKLHQASLSGSAEKLYMYLSGWLGGPQLYVEVRPSRLRARHLPFADRPATSGSVAHVHAQAMAEVHAAG